MEKAKQAAVTAAYGVGTLAVAVLLFLTAAGPRCVLYPEAMLPMDLRELASAWLAIGFLPVLMASAALYKRVRRKMVYLPTVVCLISLLYWFMVWTVGVCGATAAGIALPEPEDAAEIYQADGVLEEWLGPAGETEGRGGE